MKKQKNLSQSSRDKIEKMYQAVILLLDEGKDINSIKVADITERAGIGKGTAYEYFESKEEIIANAMRYNMKKQADSLYRLNETTESFRERVMHTLDWIENNLKYKDSGIQFFKASQFSREISTPIVEASHEAGDCSCGLHGALKLHIQAAVAFHFAEIHAVSLDRQAGLSEEFILAHGAVGGVAVVRGQQQVPLIIARVLHLGGVGLSAILIGASNAHGHGLVIFEQLFGNVVHAHLLKCDLLGLVSIAVVVVRISALHAAAREQTHHAKRANACFLPVFHLGFLLIWVRTYARVSNSF